MHQRSVEPPGEPLGQAGAGHLGCPVVVGGVAVAGQRVLGERLHQTVELGSEASFAEVCRGVHQVSLAFPPLGTAVLEPDLRERINEVSGEMFCLQTRNSRLCGAGGICKAGP